MKTLEVRLRVRVTDSVSVTALKMALAGNLPDSPRPVSWPKGTLPDPDRTKTGTIEWNTLQILQRRADR